MNAAVNAACWVVGKALAPVADTVLEAWAASAGLGQSVEDLKMELLYVQAMLNGTRDWEVDNNPALDVLLQKLKDLAYGSEGVLDEQDYFRIQDELYGTSEAADEHPNGRVHDLVTNAHHVAKAVGGLIHLPTRNASNTMSSTQRTNHAHGDANGSMRSKLTSRACNTIRSVGKCLPCSSLPHVSDHEDDGISGSSVLHNAPQITHPGETPKLRFDRVAVSKRMKLIVEEMRTVRHEVSEILRTLGCIRNNAPDTPLLSRPMTTSESTEPKLYGRDLTMKSIIHDITHGKYGDSNLTVLPIVGPGGIGKTTLTQYIYHNQEVQNYFEIRVWKCLSLNFNVDKLNEAIVKFIPEVSGENKLGTCGELIGQRLKSKRFLLILDDMWIHSNDEEWRRLLLPFKKSQVKGNIIIVTTRFPSVAQMVQTTDYPIELKGLDHTEFKKLFLAFVFGDEQPINYHILLHKIGDKIVDKLKGSPLAAKTVGRILRDRLDIDHWTRVLESKEWELEKNGHDIMPALKLSYDHLPFHLQQCFLYCALFPEDYEFDGEELIYFWIGLDILHSGGQNKKIEDIGLICLNDLVSYGFFRKEKKDGRVYYLIHDLLHDLALRVASSECVTIDRSTVRSLEIQSSARHLSIIVDNADYSDRISYKNFLPEIGKLKKRLRLENLQTLMIFGEMDESFAKCFSDLFGKANALRILRLSKTPCPVESMLDTFSALLHMRYLHLESTFSSEMHLPSAISRFYHLRILDLQAWRGHLDLPKDISNLTKLRHFLTKDGKVHSKVRNVGKLQLLQELREFQVNKESNGFDLKQLGSLIELRELGIYNLEKIHTKEEATEAKLEDKRYLRNLSLGWDSKQPNVDPSVEDLVLESLKPQGNLQYLCIRGHRGCCPTWLSNDLSVRALESLYLDDISWKILPSLGQMWMLHELTLKNITTLEIFGPNQFDCFTEQSFCNLKRFSVIGLNGLKNWVIKDTCHLFSQLQVLIIRDCPKLLELPFVDSSHYPLIQDQEEKTLRFPTLQRLEIMNCPSVKLFPPIPWSKTLCYSEIKNAGPWLFDSLKYTMSASKVQLRITGKNGLCNPNQKLLHFSNLTNLQELYMESCRPLELKHLGMLTSLKRFTVKHSSRLFMPSESDGDIEWQFPIESLWVEKCHACGKELTKFLFRLPKLSDLTLVLCNGIERMGVAVNQKQPPTYLLPSTAVKTEDTPATCQQKQIAEVEEDEKLAAYQVILLLLPDHLSVSLRQLRIIKCENLSLVLPTLVSKRDGTVASGLRTLYSLKELCIKYCPRFLSAYKGLIPSYSPFPSRLELLEIESRIGMETLEFLSKLTALTILRISRCARDLNAECLWPLLARGQLGELAVYESRELFLSLRCPQGLQDEDQEQLSLWEVEAGTWFHYLEKKEQLLHRSSKRFSKNRSSKWQELRTDEIAGVLVEPICSLLSSSLTKLTFCWDYGFKRFTEEQEKAFQHLTSLQDLTFFKVDNLQCLPEQLHGLAYLKRLEVRMCPLISSLPKDGLPRSLNELNVSYSDSEELIKQCRSFVRDNSKIKLL